MVDKHSIKYIMKRKIPTHDPQTGELNPYYEELTGEKNPLSCSCETGKAVKRHNSGCKYMNETFGDYEKKFEELLKLGMFEEAGFDVDGHPLYNLTPNGIKFFKGLDVLDKFK